MFQGRDNSSDVLDGGDEVVGEVDVEAGGGVLGDGEGAGGHFTDGIVGEVDHLYLGHTWTWGQG